MVTRASVDQKGLGDCQGHRVPLELQEIQEPQVYQDSWGREVLRDRRVLPDSLAKRASASTKPGKNTSWHQAGREQQEPWDHQGCRVSEEHLGSVEHLASPAKWACLAQADRQDNRERQEPGDSQECRAYRDLRVVDSLRKK